MSAIPTEPDPKPPRLTSAVDLVDKDIVCPTCGEAAIVRSDEHGYWIQCEGEHRPVPGVRAETLLQEHVE